jgi:lysozyme family protein
MTDHVRKAIEALIEREGGFVDHPNDRGGPTRWGVTEQVARAYGYKGDVRDLPKDTARAIFLERYWTGPRFDQVALRDAALAEELFDTGVNMGQAAAGKFLQRALNTLNRRGRHYPDIAVDGAIGRMTLHSIDQLVNARGADGLKVLLWMCNSQQSVRFMEISEANPSQEDFSFGWQLNRAILAAQDN